MHTNFDSQKKKKENISRINSRMFRESPWHINNFFSKIDRFGQPIPAFNVKGKDRVTTTFGGIVTALIMVLTLGYFVMRL